MSIHEKPHEHRALPESVSDILEALESNLTDRERADYILLCEVTKFLAEMRSQLESSTDEMVIELKLAKERAIFTNPKDEHTVDEIFKILLNNYDYGNIGFEGLRFAVDSLIRLIPMRNDAGDLVIDGRKVSPRQKHIIESRLRAPELDVMSEDGTIGSLPEDVKRQIFANNPYIELTSGCTNSCSFCAFSQHKGPILAKLSFSSVVAIIQGATDAKNYLPAKSSSFTPYYGSDPFDAKWEADPLRGIPQRDISDVYDVFKKTASDPKDCFFVSTAVPLGEELSILRYIIENIYKKNYRKTDLRISETQANKSRVEAMQNLLGQIDASLAPDPWWGKITINRTHEHTKKRGLALLTARKLDLEDFMGPECSDGLVISPSGLDSVVMSGLCAETPDGFIRRPAIEDASDGTVLVTIPTAYYSPIQTGYIYSCATSYPAITTTYRCVRSGQGQLSLDKSASDANYSPFRALLFLQWLIHDCEHGLKLYEIPENLIEAIARVVQYANDHPDDPFVQQTLEWPLPLEGNSSLRDIFREVYALRYRKPSQPTIVQHRRFG